MTELPAVVLACGAGGLLGAFFFGGLWWTVQRGVSSERPALWFLGSLVLRMGITLTGFHFASGGRWERLLVCLVGFLVAGRVVTTLTRPREESPGSSGREVTHATHPG